MQVEHELTRENVAKLMNARVIGCYSSVRFRTGDSTSDTSGDPPDRFRSDFWITQAMASTDFSDTRNVILSKTHMT